MCDVFRPHDSSPIAETDGRASCPVAWDIELDEGAVGVQAWDFGSGIGTRLSTGGGFRRSGRA
jgi:hypothetical protein